MRDRIAHVAVLTAALILLVVAPASAHPYIQGGEMPVDSLATVTLDLAHGCDSEEEGAGLDTTEVALQVPDWLWVVDVPEPDGWTVEQETGAAGDVEVVTWTTDAPEEPAPTFDLDVVAEGEVGDERHLGVFQACGEVGYRWVGTPDEPADDPAVRVTLTEPDPDSPAPEREEAPAADADAAVTDDADDAATDEAATDDRATDDAPTDDGATDDAASDDEDETTDEADEAAAPGDDDAGSRWPVIIATLLLLAVIGALVASRLRRSATDSEG